MPPRGLEPAILANERVRTHALDRAATGIIQDFHKPWNEILLARQLNHIYTMITLSG